MNDVCKLGILKLVILLGFVVLHYICVRQAMKLLLGATEEGEKGNKGISRGKLK